MPGSLPKQRRPKGNHRQLLTAFMIYSAMIAGLLAYVTVFPDSDASGTHMQDARTDAATKPARYEGVTASWNRYRARDAMAQAR